MGRENTLALLIPAERALCPYVELYTNFLEHTERSYTIIEWDRLHRNAKSEFRYQSHKVHSQMGIRDYMEYAKYAKSLISNREISSIIVFSLPLLFAFSATGGLRNKHYGVDIRDYHRAYSLPFTKRAVVKAKFCAVSSPGYSVWLPDNVKLTTSHNDHGLTKIALNSTRKFPRGVDFAKRKIVVGTIGQLKDLNANMILLDQLGNNEKYELIYHGEGIIDADLKKICHNRTLVNVKFTGRYRQFQEPALYAQCDAISMLMTPGTVNNDTLLANRVYNSALFGIPLIVFSGSYLSEVVAEYNLGIIVQNSDQLQGLDALLGDFYSNIEKFDSGRLRLKKWVQEDNEQFKVNLQKFFNMEWGENNSVNCDN